ncbi:MAG: LysR substrate-binding domain-containing protein [Parvibaculaceae bacterium]
MQDLNDLYYFAQVVEHGGFAAAGRALGLPRSKLSRRIALLEDRLGVRLVQRSTRRFSVTEIGQEYHRHCVAMLVEAEAAQETIERTRSAPYGIVRMSCASAVLYFQVGEMIARYMARHPGVGIHLEVTNRQVDLISEGFDLAVRVRFPPIEESPLIMRVLAESPQRLIASPDLLKGFVQPLVPADLARLPSLDLGPPHGETVWRLDGPDGATALVSHTPRFIANDMVALCFAVREGLGVAQLPLMMVRQDMAEGRLVEALPNWAPQSGVVHAVFPSRRGLLPAVRSLIEFLAAEYDRLAHASPPLA